MKAARLRWFLRVLAAFVHREVAAMGSYRTAFFMRLAGFGLGAGSLFFLSRFIAAGANPHLAGYGSSYLGFVVVGLLGTEFQQVGVSMLAQRIRASQIMGTLEAEVATPAPSWMVLGAPPVYEFGSAALRSAGYLLGAKLLLGLDLSRANWWTLWVSLPLIIAAFSGLGLLAAGSTMLVRRMNPVSMILGSLSVFLSGVFYPITVLPHWLRVVGKALPLTHALAALRGALLLGVDPGRLKEPLVALLLFAAVLAPAGAATFAYALRRARTDGSLSHY